MKLKHGYKITIYTPSGHFLLVDIYPVGVFDEITNSWRTRSWKMRLKTIFAYPFHGEWRAFKNAFNGYIAEPDIMPGRLKKCGTGWTRKRALRDLKRKVRRYCP